MQKFCDKAEPQRFLPKTLSSLKVSDSNGIQTHNHLVRKRTLNTRYTLSHRLLILYTVAIWERFKGPELPKETIQKLILNIFSISDLLEKLIKIVTKAG